MENPVVQRPQTLDRIKENLIPHQLDSFFDHDVTDLRDQKPLWVSPNKVRYNDQKHKIIMECPMEKQGRKIPSWKLRHFVLTEEFLAYKEKQASKNIKRVMALDRVRLEMVTSKENDKTRYGFQFSKNKKSASIFTTNQQLYEKFRNELEKRCILSTFGETYEIEKLIGQGSFGKVYLVKRRSDGKEFAAKMFIKNKVVLRTKGKLSLINEIKILRKLDHSGIMKLYKVYETMIGILLVMELLEGGELFEHLKEKKTFTERDCAFMLIRIMDPLVYMHDKQIAHRDIKPENLILRSKKDGYDIVIADFGLAESLTLPTLFVKCGSPGYCAPEILNAKGDIITYDTKCDVFSVGCVFYHMVTGKSPFWSKYPKETYHLNKSAAVVFEDPKVTALSTAAQDLLKKMLNKDPAQRPSFNECLKHYYFQEAFQVHHSPIVNFRLKLTLSGSSYHSHHKSGELELKEKASLDSQGETISFIFGRSNIIKGRLDTLQEISTNIKTKQIKNNLLQLTNNVEDKQSSRRKSGSLQVQASPKKETKDYESVGSSSDFDSLNESNEIGRLAWVEKPLEICSKVNKVKNEGIINNPFLEMASTDKDFSSGFIKLIVSESGKASFTVFPTRFRHLNKSDDFRKIHM